MKLHHYIVLGATLIGLVACETRESLTGSELDLAEGTGALALTVDAKEPVSTKAGISTSDFPVIISTEEDEIIKEYLVKNLPEKISLEIGKYKVEAHSPFELEKEMDKAYYAGHADLTIINQVTSQVKVTCKRQNCRISLNYGNDFRSAFKSWTITLNDGSESVLEYAYDGQGFPSNPEDVYWYFEPNTVEKIKVQIDAITKEGQRISDERIYAKADAFESYIEDTKYFTGGDALDIYLEVAKIDAPTEGDLSGIVIFDISLWTEDSSESVNIPVEDEVITPSPEGPEDPAGPGNADIEITEPNGNTYLVDGVVYPTVDGSIPNVVINMAFVKGVKHMYVLASSDNSKFANALGVMGGLTTSPGLDLTSSEAIDNGLDALFDLPKVGDLTYSFTLKPDLLDLMNKYGKGIHLFELRAVDTEGNEVTKILKVMIVETEISGGE